MFDLTNPENLATALAKWLQAEADEGRKLLLGEALTIIRERDAFAAPDSGHSKREAAQKALKGLMEIDLSAIEEAQWHAVKAAIQGLEFICRLQVLPVAKVLHVMPQKEGQNFRAALLDPQEGSEPYVIFDAEEMHADPADMLYITRPTDTEEFGSREKARPEAPDVTMDLRWLRYVQEGTALPRF